MALVLASASPRRSEILHIAGIEDFLIMPASGEPELRDISPDEIVRRTARFKADSIRSKMPEDIIIAADTLVFLDGEVLGKPRDEADAFRMLRMLSDRTHTVYTGVALSTPEKTICRAERAEVTFRHMTDDEINWYISTGAPMDKAGAYGVQGPGARFIEGINGDFFNVMGLPVCRLFLMADELGITL